MQIHPMNMTSTVSGFEPPPDGVQYVGARAVGPYLVLRYVDERLREETMEYGTTEWHLYRDSYFDSHGAEIFRETGEIARGFRSIPHPAITPQPQPWWRRLF